MRIVSLFPAGTEIVTALGAGGSLVGISHACDHPRSVQHLPRVTTTPVDTSQSSAAVDAEVRRRQHAGEPVILVDAEALRALQPDLILTQELCAVCAVEGDQLRELADALDPAPHLLSLSGGSLEGVEADIRRVAEALNLAEDGEEVVAGMRYRLRGLAPARAAAPSRVVCVEWLEPLYLAGHWVPELVAAAGGEDVAGRVGEKSRRRAWAEVAAMRPDIILIMLCGVGLARARDEWATFARGNPGVVSLLGPARVRFVDGNAFTSRPGPRLVEGAQAIHAALRS